MYLLNLTAATARRAATWLSATTVAAVALLASNQADAQTYYNLAASNFSETFADIASTTIWATPSTGSWRGFTGTVTSPATGVPDANKTTTNSSAFVTSLSSGGIQRGSAQTPAAQNLVFLSTGGANLDNTTATAIDLLLDFTGRNAGNLTFDAAMLANGTPPETNTRQGTLRVYASIDGSTWTEITGANLPFIATNNTAYSATINVALPALLNNQAQGRLRFYYHNNGGGTAPTGSRPKITIDNVGVTSTSAVAGQPVISSATTASVTANSAFSYSIVASGSPTSYAAAPLPNGLSLNTTTGVISGSPTTPGVTVITLSATNAAGTGQATLTLTVNTDPNAPVMATGQVLNTVLNTAITPYQLLASNGVMSYTSGALPAGLTLDTSTGIISGTPTVFGTFTVAVTAINASGTGTANLSIVVSSAPVISSELSASVYVNQPFSYTVTDVTQADYPISGVVWSGLPDGIAKTTPKVITGTPTTPGTYNIGIAVSNDLNGTSTTNVTLTLKVVDQAMQDAIPVTVVVNEYVNATTDRVELLVIGDGTAGSTADLRGMILKDFSSNLTTDNGGKYVFTSNSLWSAVPAGTLIVLSNGNSDTENLLGFVLRVNLGDTTYFTSYGSFDIATSEMVMIKPAGYGTLGIAGGMHALANGVSDPLPADTALLKLYRDFTGKKLSATGANSATPVVVANNSTSSLVDFTGTASAYTSLDAAVAVTPTLGAANNATNQTYIDSLRVTVTPNTPLQNWLIAHFGTATDTPALLIGNTEDYDGDGIANIVEYAFGTDPAVATSSPVVASRSGNFLTLSFPRVTDSALTYTVQASSDLATGFTTATGGTVTTGGVSTYTDNVDLSAPGVRRFLRVSITYTP